MTKIDLGDLTPRDIGRTVTITHRDTTITGQLNDFRVDTDWITHRSFDQSPDDAEQIPGRRTVSVTVGPWSTDRLPINAQVEVQR